MSIDNSLIYLLGLPDQIYKMRRSLQTYSQRNQLPKRSWASCPDPWIRQERGSVTVEVSLAFPIFICALCAILTLGQFLLIDVEVQHAVSQTARTVAKERAIALSYKEGGNGEDSKKTNESSEKVSKSSGSGLGEKLLEAVGTQVGFFNTFLTENCCMSCVVGGRAGIVVTASCNEENSGMITVRAVYGLRVPVLFFQKIILPKTVTISQRAFTGYEPHGDGTANGVGRVVYTTATGSVYHTTLECSYLTRKISGQTKASLSSQGYRPCERCAKRFGADISAVYITSGGTCYHTSLSCSELKRTIRATPIKEVGEMQVCSRCGGGYR